LSKRIENKIDFNNTLIFENQIMEKCSYFIKNKALFGAYPTQENVYELEKNGVILFIDLTNEKDDLPKYTTNYEKIHYPIVDRGIPSNVPDFCRFVLCMEKRIKNLKNNEKIYIHCKAGHSRSSLLVACIIAHILRISGEEAIKLTTDYHRQRKMLTPSRREGIVPTRQQQINFIIRMFRPLYFYIPRDYGCDKGFSNFTNYSVKTELGTFPTSENAFQAYKDPSNSEYVCRLMHEKNPITAKKMGRYCKLREDWVKIRDEVMFKILRAKFAQHADIKDTLMNSGFRPIMYHTDKDKYYGDEGKNVLGLILEKVRERLFLNLYKI